MTDYELTAMIEAQRERRCHELVDTMRRIDRAIADWLRWMHRIDVERRKA